MSRYYRPMVGDLVQLTRGKTVALVIDTDDDRNMAQILYGQSGYKRQDPFSHIHRYELDVTADDLHKLYHQLDSMPDGVRKTKLLRALDRYAARVEGFNQIPCEGKTQKETENMKTLYEWKNAEGNSVYGYKLATNSAGEWVMEGKDGNIYSVDRKIAQEVMPYTVDVTFAGENKQHYSFFAKSGDYEAGDVIAHPSYGPLLHVVKVDTKSKAAKVWLYGFKLQGVKIESGE